MLNIPCDAIRCFEKLTGMQICCYSYSPVFSRLFPWKKHRFKVCALLKEHYASSCLYFDNIYVAENSWRFPEGFIKTCHGNFSELALPVIRNGKLLCLLFAGIFRTAPEENPMPEIKNIPRSENICGFEIRQLSAEELHLLAEALKQLRARLLIWYDDMHKNELICDQLSKKEQILLIFSRESSRGLTLKKLASMLHLSYPRTSHLVRELTGRSFAELLRKQRLENACNLLTMTRMSVAEIAAESGFGNTVNFYRTFKREFALTPQEFRKKHPAESSLLFSESLLK